MRLRTDRWILLWALALAVILLGPALGSGPVLSYDMVWVPDLALTRDVVGLGSGLPRAVPSDAVIAVLDEIVPGIWLQKLVLLGALTAAGLGAARLVNGPPVARVAAAGIYEWNALVVERLVIGHWPVLIGYAALPWLLALARRWREEGRLPAPLLLLLPIASLSASAGLVTAIAVTAAAWGPGRRRTLGLLLIAANAPWLVAGLLHASTASTDPAGAQAFALNDEGSMPGPLAALTLGGIWNADVVPASRGGALGWLALSVVIVLGALGLRRWRQHQDARERTTLVVMWVIGWVVASTTWLAPDAVGRLGEVVPGTGLIRDGARLLALCAPLLAVLVAHGTAAVSSRLRPSRSLTVTGILVAGLLPVALLPDAALGVGGRLDPATYPATWQSTRAALHDAEDRIDGDLLILPLTAFRAPQWNGGRTVFDPLGRYLGRPYLATDVFAVSGTVIAGEDPRIPEVVTALAAASPAERANRLLAVGVGAVVREAVVREATAPTTPTVPEIAGTTLPGTTADLVVTVLAGEPAVDPPSRAAVLAIGAAWASYAGLLLAGLGSLVRKIVIRRRRC